jgi:hypothetical protein
MKKARIVIVALMARFIAVKYDFVCIVSFTASTV